MSKYQSFNEKKITKQFFCFSFFFELRVLYLIRIPIATISYKHWVDAFDGVSVFNVMIKFPKTVIPSRKIMFGYLLITHFQTEINNIDITEWNEKGKIFTLHNNLKYTIDIKMQLVSIMHVYCRVVWFFFPLFKKLWEIFFVISRLLSFCFTNSCFWCDDDFSTIKIETLSHQIFKNYTHLKAFPFTIFRWKRDTRAVINVIPKKKNKNQIKSNHTTFNSN